MSENRESCDCRQVADYDHVERPGDFYFKPIQNVPGETCLHIMLPGDTFIWIPVSRGEKLPRVWLWDGNETKPTVSPSIHTIGHWHGFLRGGRLESC
jgi:hypothetical protein